MGQREEGYVEVITSDSGGAWRLPRSEYEDVKASWMRGEAFIETVTYYGTRLVLKAGRIESVADWSRDSLEALREHTAEEKARELTE